MFYPVTQENFSLWFPQWFAGTLRCAENPVERAKVSTLRSVSTTGSWKHHLPWCPKNWVWGWCYFRSIQLCVCVCENDTNATTKNQPLLPFEDVALCWMPRNSMKLWFFLACTTVHCKSWLRSLDLDVGCCHECSLRLKHLSVVLQDANSLSDF